MNPQQRAAPACSCRSRRRRNPGVKNNLFIRTALNAVREAPGEPALDAFDFLGGARTAATRLGFARAMLSRRSTTASRAASASCNELLQLALLQPRPGGAGRDRLRHGHRRRARSGRVGCGTCDRAARLLIGVALSAADRIAGTDAVLKLDQGCIAGPEVWRWRVDRAYRLCLPTRQPARRGGLNGQRPRRRPVCPRSRIAAGQWIPRSAVPSATLRPPANQGSGWASPAPQPTGTCDASPLAGAGWTCTRWADTTEPGRCALAGRRPRAAG